MKKITIMLLLVAITSISFSQNLRSLRSSQPKNVVSKNSNTISSTISNVSRTPISSVRQTLSFSKNGGAASANSILFTDDFNSDNSIAGLVARGYLTYFNGTGGPGLLPEWVQGDPTVFTAYNGPDSGYVGSSYNSVTGTNDLDNWLVLPALNIGAGDTLSFWSHAPQASTFPDSVRVMYSAIGDSTPGGSWVQLGNFEVSTSGSWIHSFFSAPTAGTTARFAIRHSVVNSGPNGNNGDFIGIDQIDVFEAGTTTGSTGPVNDDCAGSIDLNSSLGQPIGTVTTSGPYNNDSATVGATDPTFGFECWGEPDGAGANPTIDNSLWFSFTGDGNNYFIETGNCGGGLPDPIDDGDTQIAIYTGSCGSLTPVACNEDGPSATGTYYPAGLTLQTVPGTVYYMMIDGFNFQGALSTGQFCVNISQIASVACGSPSVTVGTISANNDTLCGGDTLTITVSGAVAPTIASSGFAWVITTADISGNSDPLNDPSLVTSYGVVNPAPTNSSLNYLINDGTFIGTAVPYGVYYWTPVAFGNATVLNNPATFLQDYTLDPSCTVTGTSIMVAVLDPTDPACTVGLNDIPASLGITSLYPVPVKNTVSFKINSKENSPVELTIKDAVGKVIYTEKRNVTSGSNLVSISMKQYSAGVYFISVKNKNSVSIEKFVKE